MLMVLNLHMKTKLLIPSNVIKNNRRENLKTKREIVNCIMCKLKVKFRREGYTQKCWYYFCASFCINQKLIFQTAFLLVLLHVTPLGSSATGGGGELGFRSAAALALAGSQHGRRRGRAEEEEGR